MAKIMLVEDDKSLREIYSIRLAAEGYDIVSAGDGEEALGLAVQEKPDLIISDVMMPKISGFDMLDILRATPTTRDIKVIVMTALSGEEQRQRSENLGADRHLVKSQCGIEDIVNAVHEVLGDLPNESTKKNLQLVNEMVQKATDTEEGLNLQPVEISAGAPVAAAVAGAAEATPGATSTPEASSAAETTPVAEVVAPDKAAPATEAAANPEPVASPAPVEKPTTATSPAPATPGSINLTPEQLTAILSANNTGAAPVMNSEVAPKEELKAPSKRVTIEPLENSGNASDPEAMSREFDALLGKEDASAPDFSETASSAEPAPVVAAPAPAEAVVSTGTAAPTDASAQATPSVTPATNTPEATLSTPAPNASMSEQMAAMLGNS